MTRNVEIVPRVGRGSGIPGGAWNRAHALRELGVAAERITYAEARRGRFRPWLRSRPPRSFAHGWRIVWFTTIGPARARRFLAERPDALPICHNNVNSWRAIALRYLDLAEELLAEREQDASVDVVARRSG